MNSIFSTLPRQVLNQPYVPTLTNTTTSLYQQSVRNATKKAGGSSSNGRDSIGRRLGIKVWPNKATHAEPGNIIVRQRGLKFKPGINVGVGKDHTIYAKAAGIVHMTKLETNKKRNLVHVIPRGQEHLLETIAGRRYGVKVPTEAATTATTMEMTATI